MRASGCVHAAKHLHGMPPPIHGYHVDRFPFYVAIAVPLCALWHKRGTRGSLFFLGGGVLQSDVSGTLEAIKAALSVLPQDRVALRFLLAAPSEITASDVDLAFASGGFIVGFNTEPSDSVAALAKQRGPPLVQSLAVCRPLQCRSPAFWSSVQR